jgi:serine/threonine-protein kinase
VFAPGSVIAGKYRIERMLGEGGMGVVVAAVHLGLGTRVALKFLHPQIRDNAIIVERFLREARASAALRGEHVCRVSDVGTFDDGTPYFVMELLDGRDLASVLSERGPLPTQLVADYLLQACVGIAEAHALHIIHRDIKPGNLFVTARPDGTPLVKVLDFGVAKAPQDGNFSLTQTANVMGSPGYMSPEQLRSSKEADVRSDIWSLGATMYELACGRQPWVAESITELTLKIAMDPLPSLPGSVPSALASVIARCLEKDPAARFPNVGALANALAPLASGGGAELAAGVVRVLRGNQPSGGSRQSAVHGAAVGTDPTVAGVAGVASVPTTMAASSGAITASPRTRTGWRLPVALTALVVVGGGITALVATTGGRMPTATPAAEPQLSPQPQPATATPTTPILTPGTTPIPSPSPAPSPSPTPSPTPGTSPIPSPIPIPSTTPTPTFTTTPTPTFTTPPTSKPTPPTAKPQHKPHKPPKQAVPEDINDSRI